MKTPAATLFSFLLMTSGSSALTLSQNCLGVPPLGLAPTELSGNVSCPQFSLAGTLTAITLDLSGWIEGTITVSNNNMAPLIGSAATNVRFNFGPLAGFTLLNPLFTAVADMGEQTIVPGTSSAFMVAGNGTATSTNTSNFTPYVGSGRFSIPVSTNTFLLLGFGTKVTATQSTSARAEARITYDYRPITTVPEPATIVLLGSGLLAAAVRRRRRT